MFGEIIYIASDQQLLRQFAQKDVNYKESPLMQELQQNSKKTKTKTKKTQHKKAHQSTKQKK